MSELSLLEYQVLSRVITKFPIPANFKIMSNLFPVNNIDADGAKWDVIKNGRGIGTFKSPGAPATQVANLGVSRSTSQFASIAFEKTLSEQELIWNRQPGTVDTPYLEQKITREQADLNRLIDMTMEYAASKALTGTFAVNQDDVKFSVDYGIDATHKVTAGTLWSDLDNSDPLADIDTWKQLIAADSGEVATQMWLNSKTLWSYVLRHSAIRELLRAEFGRELVAGQTPQKISELEIVIYDGGYVASGTFTKYIPDGKVILLAKTPDFGETQVGSALIPSGDTLRKVVGKYSYSYISKNPAKQMLIAGANFLPVINRVENIVYATVA